MIILFNQLIVDTKKKLMKKNFSRRKQRYRSKTFFIMRSQEIPFHNKGRSCVNSFFILFEIFLLFLELHENGFSAY